MPLFAHHTAAPQHGAVADAACGPKIVGILKLRTSSPVQKDRALAVWRSSAPSRWAASTTETLTTFHRSPAHVTVVDTSLS